MYGFMKKNDYYLNEAGEWTFQVKAFSFSELACRYSPDVTPNSAQKRLKEWVKFYPGLLDNLRAIGYYKGKRMLTPAMVKLIVSALGDP
jgi:hypothetical protein